MADKLTDETVKVAINNSIPIQSVLYDLNLLPEQLKPDTIQWTMMKATVQRLLDVAEIERYRKALKDAYVLADGYGYNEIADICFDALAEPPEGE